jgi:hypothetical protein
MGLATVSIATPARACDINCDNNVPKHCTCSTTTCDISTNKDYFVDTILDCSGKDVSVSGPNGAITITDSLFTLKANNVTIALGHKIDAQANDSDTGFGIELDLTGKLDLGGFLRANSAYGGGSITVRAAGDVSIPPTGTQLVGQGVLAEATGAQGAGGNIEIDTDGDLAVKNPISVDASQLGPAQGGSINIRARNMVFDAKLSASGKNDDAGSIELFANSDVAGKGNIVLNKRVAAEGAGVEGNGGSIEMTADAGISINDEVTVQGGVGGPGQSSGGRVFLQAGAGGVSIVGNINATSGALGSNGGSGASIAVESAGPITVYSGYSLVTRSDANGGDGGSIVLASDSDVTIGNSVLDASGHSAGSNQGPGGRIKLAGCDLIVSPAASLRAPGYVGGGIELIAGARLDVSTPQGGTATVVTADGTGSDDGTIELTYRSAATCATKNGAGVRPICVVGDVCRGRCSNSPTTSCSTNQNCTIGCSTGVCQAKRCQNPDLSTCSTDADCNVCASLGGCVANPLTANTSFTPAPPTLREHRGLARCDQLSDEE